MTDPFDDLDELDVYNADDPLHIRLELLERIVARALIDRTQRAPTSELLEAVWSELDAALDRIDAFRVRIRSVAD